MKLRLSAGDVEYSLIVSRINFQKLKILELDQMVNLGLTAEIIKLFLKKNKQKDKIIYFSLDEMYYTHRTARARQADHELVRDFLKKMKPFLAYIVYDEKFQKTFIENDK